MERRDGARLTWIGRVARSKVFVGLNAVALPTLLLLAGLRFGPALAAAVRPTQPAISISGPGVSQASASVTAYILGDVAQPGVYTLAVGARVQALVAAAGGALDNADLTRVDLAALVVDGQEIYVPRIGEPIPLMLGGKVDINVASASDLHHALGIEVAIANRIVAYRVAHGAFTAISQLLLVPISLSEYNKIKSLVTV